MSFKSKAQQRFLFARHPKVAREFASKTKSFKALPERSNLNETIKRARRK